MSCMLILRKAENLFWLDGYRQTSNIRLIPMPKCCSCLCPIHWSQENGNVLGPAPTGDAPVGATTTTREWSAILLHTKVPLILEVWGLSEQYKIIFQWIQIATEKAHFQLFFQLTPRHLQSEWYVIYHENIHSLASPNLVMNASDDFQFRRLLIPHIVVQTTEVTQLEKWCVDYNGCNYEASSMVLRARYFPPVFQMAFECSYGIHSVTKRTLEK